MVRKPKFRPHELALLHALKHARYEMTTGELAEATGMGWATAKKNLEKLYDKGIIEKKEAGKSKRRYWRFEE